MFLFTATRKWRFLGKGFIWQDAICGPLLQALKRSCWGFGRRTSCTRLENKDFLMYLRSDLVYFSRFSRRFDCYTSILILSAENSLFRINESRVTCSKASIIGRQAGVFSLSIISCTCFRAAVRRPLWSMICILENSFSYTLIHNSTKDNRFYLILRCFYSHIAVNRK